MEAQFPDCRLPRDERLRSKKAITRLFGQGRGGFVYPLRYVFVGSSGEVPDDEYPSVLVSVPKRNHKRANVRNLLKRRMREAYRLNKRTLPSVGGERMPLAFLYAAAEVCDYATIDDAVRKILRTVGGDV